MIRKEELLSTFSGLGMHMGEQELPGAILIAPSWGKAQFLNQSIKMPVTCQLWENVWCGLRQGFH